ALPGDPRGRPAGGPGPSGVGFRDHPAPPTSRRAGAHRPRAFAAPAAGRRLLHPSARAAGRRAPSSPASGAGAPRTIPLQVRPVPMNPEPITTQPLDTLERAREAVAAAADRKAVDLKVLQLEKVTDFADYFLICSGTSERQVQAIADAVQERLREHRVRPL